MRFADAGMLWFLILPVVIAAILTIGIWTRKNRLDKFGQAQTLNLQLLRASPYLRAAKSISLVLGVAAMVFCTARPQYGGQTQSLKKRGIDVVVALDFSKSMLAQDVQPSRLERAKLELNSFINQLTGDRIGLVAFAGDTIKYPLTNDYSAATTFWRGMTPYEMPVGGTAIGKAITAASRMLFPEDTEKNTPELAQRSKVIVLLTDGEDHLGDPVAAAEEAASKGIVIYTIGIGSDSPELIPRRLDDGSTLGYQKTQKGQYVTTALTAENEETLKEIASKTSGRYFKAGNDLSAVATVIKEIRMMKQEEDQSRLITVYAEVYQWFLIPAVILLLIAFLLPDRLWWRERRRA